MPNVRRIKLSYREKDAGGEVSAQPTIFEPDDKKVDGKVFDDLQHYTVWL